MFKLNFKSEEYPQEENRRIDQSKRNDKEQKKTKHDTYYEFISQIYDWNKNDRS